MSETKKDMSTYFALQAVQADARKQQAWHKEQLTKPPLFGWTREKHEKYHNKHIEESEIVMHYCFIRMMQISPD